MNKERSEIIKNYVTIIAIIVGGIWALYTFTILGEAKKNELEIEQKKEDIAGKLGLQLELNVKQNEHNKGVFIELTLKNNGSRFVPVSMPDSSMAIFKLKSFKSSNGIITGFYDLSKTKFVIPDLGGIISDSKYYAEYNKGTTVQPYTSIQINYYTEVDTSGIYLIRFKTVMDDSSASVIKNKTDHFNENDSPFLNSQKDDEDKDYWTATKFIDIK